MTKNIVPRAAGEGSLGIAAKPWGVVYANSIPLADSKITTHNNASTNVHANGISGNAATASKLLAAVKINGVAFDGSKNIDIPLRTADGMTAAEALSVFNGTYNATTIKAVTQEALNQIITSMKDTFLTDTDVTNAIIEKRQGVKTLERNTTYKLGEAVYSHALLKGLYLECIKAGTTGSSEPAL